jgi:hypothetical protein
MICISQQKVNLGEALLNRWIFYYAHSPNQVVCCLKGWLTSIQMAKQIYKEDHF